MTRRTTLSKLRSRTKIKIFSLVGSSEARFGAYQNLTKTRNLNPNPKKNFKFHSMKLIICGKMNGWFQLIVLVANIGVIRRLKYG